MKRIIWEGIRGEGNKVREEDVEEMREEGGVEGFENIVY